MRIAVIGAGRRNNGIGAYIARFAKADGADVVAVLAQDIETAHRDAESLQQWGVAAVPYADLGLLIRRENPDALVIASPAITHAGYLGEAIDAGLHVLCEKPLIWDDGCDCSLIARLLAAARERGLTVAMNSQWPFVLPAYERLCGLPQRADIRSFRIELSPLVSGRDMIPDSLPHALSLLFSTLGAGCLEEIRLFSGHDCLTAGFDYVTDAGSCRVEALLTKALRQPRPFAFGFNGKLARREIDMAVYRIAFVCDGRRIEVDDPLQQSVKDFLNACRSAQQPRIGFEHILETMRMLQQLYAFWPQQRLHEQEVEGGKTSQQGT
jgi:predicted dehydrogenase